MEWRHEFVPGQGGAVWFREALAKLVLQSGEPFTEISQQGRDLLIHLLGIDGVKLRESLATQQFRWGHG